MSTEQQPDIFYNVMGLIAGSAALGFGWIALNGQKASLGIYNAFARHSAGLSLLALGTLILSLATLSLTGKLRSKPRAQQNCRQDQQEDTLPSEINP